MPATKADLKLTQYLNEALAMEQALTRTLRTHIAMTPRGSYREALEEHLGETGEHSSLLQERLREIGSGASLTRVAIGAAEVGVGLAQSFAGQVLALWKAPIDLVRGGLSGEEKLLKNAKDECATEALEIATYQAVERLAEAVGDEETGRLAMRIRHEEERMLGRLRREIPALTAAVVGAEVEGRRTYRRDRTGAADSARRMARSTARKARRATSVAAEQAETVAERTARATAAASSAAAKGVEAVGVQTAGVTRSAGTEAAEQVEAAGKQTARAAEATGKAATEQVEAAGEHTASAAEVARNRRPRQAERRGRGRRDGDRQTGRRPARGSDKPAGDTARREPRRGHDGQKAPEVHGSPSHGGEGTEARVSDDEREQKDRTTVVKTAGREVHES